MQELLTEATKKLTNQQTTQCCYEVSLVAAKPFLTMVKVGMVYVIR